MIEFYTKADCSLCEKAKAVLLPIAAQEGAAVREVDIQGSVELTDKYGEEIPVVLIDGKKAFRWRVDDVDRLRSLIRAAQGRRHD